MKRCLLWSLVAAIALLTACSSNEQGGIRLHYSWTDAEGNDITPPDLTVLFAWAELTFPDGGGETKTAGPSWMGDEESLLRFTGLPYGPDMRLAITLRRADTTGNDSDIIGGDDAPDARPDNVAYYCTSQDFKLVRGKVTDVENACIMQPAAGVDPETGKPTPPALKVYDPDGKELTEADATTRHTTVTLCYTALNATKVTIANDAGFEEDVITEAIPETTGTAPCPEGYHAHPDWSLGKAPDPKNDRAQRTVFLKASDAQGYETKPASRKIFIDNKPPVIVNPLINPENANGSSAVSVSFSFHEPVQSVVLDAGTLTFDRIGDLTDEQLFIYKHQVIDADAEGEYSFAVTAVDMAGNLLEKTLDKRLVVDKTAPAIETPAVIICDGTDCATEKTKGKAGDLVKVSFTVSETITVPPTVQIAGRDMALCTGATGYEYCYAIAATGETDGAKPVTVLLTDDAGNNNAEDNKLEAMPYFDVTAPQILNSSISPTAAKNGAEVIVSFTFSEPVTDYAFAVLPLAFTDSDCATNDEQLYTCAYTVAGTETQNTPYQPAVTCSDEAGNECADHTFGAFEIDYTIPDIAVTACGVVSDSGVIRDGITAAAVGHIVEVTLALTAEEGVTPLLTLGSVPATGTCAVTPPDGSICSAHTVSDGDSEGNKLVAVDAVDAAGNLYSQTVSIVDCSALYDFSGPLLTSANLLRLPDFMPARDNLNKVLSFSLTDPLTDEAVTAQLNLYADEELDPATASIAGLDLGEPTEVTGNFAQFERILDDSLAEGQYSFTVTWRDLLGNEAVRPVDWKMFLDKTAPDAAIVDMQKVLYTRKPWGTDDTGGKPKFSVAGENSAVTDTDIATIIAYNEQGSIIGQTSVTGGAFDIPTLTGGDLPNIYLNPVKKSGVKATGNGALVTEVQWHATMGGKVAGSTLGNPHTFYTNALFNKALDQEPDLLQEPLSGGQAYTETRGEPIWKQWGEKRTPLMGTNFAMAYDSLRGKAVLFGGSLPLSDKEYNETWEWSGFNWNQSNPTFKPSVRSGHAMAYDSARGTTLLFGGGNNINSQNFNDTWEWNGTNWRQLHPINMPPEQSGHKMAYDPVRNMMVLFGQTGTWEWNGNNWTEKISVNTPSTRISHAMVYDGSRNKILLFGGYASTSPYYPADTWEWDGADWIQLSPANNPSSRTEHAMAYDSSRRKVLLFGGNDSSKTCSGGSSSYCQDTWEWDGTNWILLNPEHKPSERSRHVMTYDSTRDKILLFGGYNGTSAINKENWIWDGVDWQEVKLGQSTIPLPRTGHAMVFDDERGKLLMFGGYVESAANNNNETWEGDKGWTLLTPTTLPAERTEAAMVYDSDRNRAVLFGGSVEGSPNNETWEWDGQNWIQRKGSTCTGGSCTVCTVSTCPSARVYHAMAYDSAQKKVMLFGGTDGSRRQDTWEWDGSNWTERFPTTSPSARSSHAMAYDNVRDRVVMYGGAWSDETWEWDGIDWMQMNPANKPSERAGHKMVFDNARGKVILFGGDNGDYVVYDETWEWDGTNWKRLTLTNYPGKRYSHEMTYDSLHDKVILSYGDYLGVFYNDTWEWHGGGNDRAGQMLHVAFERAGVSEYAGIQALSVLFNAGGIGDIIGTPTEGVDLLTWKHDKWVTVSSNDAGPDNLASLAWNTTDNAEIQTLLNSGKRKFNFAVVPSAPNGFLPDMGAVATDYAEVIVRYWLPPAVGPDCGNGTIDAGEQCDDGNSIATDSCAYCRSATCGDGFVRAGVEECDDRNTAEDDSCYNDCTRNICGDGIVNVGVEECDDSNAVNEDSCTNGCKTNVCGDGVIWTGQEDCDDKNDDDTDACIACVAAECGDGFIQTGVEDCEDGGTADGDGCDSDCQWETRTYTCTAKPGGTSTDYNAVSSYTQTFNGTDWLPVDDPTTEYNATSSATSCRYTCAAGYGWTGTECRYQVTLGTGTTTQNNPFNDNYGYRRSASIYTAAEVAHSGSISRLAWYASAANSDVIPVRIYLKTTTAASFTAAGTWAGQISGATLVYDSTITHGSNEWVELTLSTAFAYNGTDNLLVLTEMNYGGTGGAGTGSYRFTVQGANMMQYWYQDSTPPAGNGTTSANRSNVRILF